MSLVKDVEILKNAVEKAIREEISKPLVVSIMGQTGVGKTSLINALFNVDLPVDDVQPCTKDIEKVIAQGSEGHELWFYDLPGIGESDKKDAEYMEAYKEKLLESDVVLWAIHADSRAVYFDLESLDKILNSFQENQKTQLLNKITFVMTKVDLLTHSPWIFAKTGKNGFFTPGKATTKVIDRKQQYYRDILIRPYENSLKSSTYRDNDQDQEFSIEHPNFTVDEFEITYTGKIFDFDLAELQSKYPNHADVFERLSHNYEVIPCSSRFRFNLSYLMLVIVNKLGKEAIGRFNQFIHEDTMNNLAFSHAQRMCNMLIFDMDKQKVVFDLNKIGG
ncbi:MAG: GTPase [Cyanobacteria bacterium P01_D01_bin.156]